MNSKNIPEGMTTRDFLLQVADVAEGIVDAATVDMAVARAAGQLVSRDKRQEMVSASVVIWGEDGYPQD